MLQIKAEARCGAEAAGYCCGLQRSQLHATAGVCVRRKEPALAAGDQRHSHPQQRHRLRAPARQRQHLSAM